MLNLELLHIILVKRLRKQSLKDHALFIYRQLQHVELKILEFYCTPNYLLIYLGSGSKRRWSSEEKNINYNVFKDCMDRKQLPSLNDIQVAISNYSELQNRTPPQVKTWMNNIFLKEKRASRNS